MSKVRSRWLAMGAKMTSYRAMHDLSYEIIESPYATISDRRAARRVHRLLSGLIDKPIASAKRLTKARDGFRHLIVSLENKNDTTPIDEEPEPYASLLPVRNTPVNFSERRFR